MDTRARPALILATPTEDECRLLPVLSETERATAARIRDRARRSSYVGRHGLLRQELATRSGLPLQDVIIEHHPCRHCGGPHGRPYAPGVGIEFSMSSALPHVALAFADRPVGVDLEPIADLDVVRDVAGQLHPREKEAVAVALTRSADFACGVFTGIWTRKEALLKATGEGLTAPLDRDDVSDVTRRPVPGWRIETFQAPAGMAGAWALAI